MLTIATVALAADACLSVLAILSFSWSMVAARALLRCAIVAAGVAAFGTPALLGKPDGGILFWAFLFACASWGSNFNAARNLFSRSTRWVHRFVIYSGYGATFAVMGVVALALHRHGASLGQAGVAFIGAYVLGSASIFLAKALTVRRVLKTMPEYQAALGSDGKDQGYW